MQSAEKMLSLKWSSFPSQLAISMDTCYEKQQFVDVSLVCKDGTILKCHKMVLANASTFFCRLLVANEHPHPMIILHDIDADDLKTIVNFMYSGEIQVVQSEVRRLLRIANILEVTGLTQIQTMETGSQDLENRILENVNKIDQRNVNKNGSDLNPGLNKLVQSQRFESIGGRFDSVNTRFDSSSAIFDSANPRFDSNNTKFDNNARFDSNNQSPRFDVNSQRFDFNQAIRYDSNPLRFDLNAGRFPLNALRFPRRVENVTVNQRRIETFNRSPQYPEPRKEFAQGVEVIQTNRLRLAKAGIDIQEGTVKDTNSFFWLCYAHYFTLFLRS